MIDPKSGENVTESANAQDTLVRSLNYSRFELIRYFRDLACMVAVTDQRQVIVWKWNPAAAARCYEAEDPIECMVAHEKASSLVLFTGDTAGNVMKWEKSASNSKKMVPQKLDLSTRNRRGNAVVYKLAPLKEGAVTVSEEGVVNVPDQIEKTSESKTLSGKNSVRNCKFQQHQALF